MLESKLFATIKAGQAHRVEGYIYFSVTGVKGGGKTTYTIKVMTQVFMALGYGEDDAYRMALKHLLYDKKEVISFLRHHSGHQQAIMTWDDCRVHGSGMSYITAPRETQILSGLFDTARDSVACIMTTAPSSRGLLSFLKNELGWKGQVVPLYCRKEWRECRLYSRYELPTGDLKITGNKISDTFHYRLPDDVYEIIRAKRSKYKEILLNNIDKMIAKSLDKENKQLQSELLYLKDSEKEEVDTYDGE